MYGFRFAGGGSAASVTNCSGDINWRRLSVTLRHSRNQATDRPPLPNFLPWEGGGDPLVGDARAN